MQNRPTMNFDLRPLTFDLSTGHIPSQANLDSNCSSFSSGSIRILIRISFETPVPIHNHQQRPLWGSKISNAPFVPQTNDFSPFCRENYSFLFRSSRSNLFPIGDQLTSPRPWTPLFQQRPLWGSKFINCVPFGDHNSKMNSSFLQKPNLSDLNSPRPLTFDLRPSSTFQRVNVPTCKRVNDTSHLANDYFRNI